MNIDFITNRVKNVQTWTYTNKIFETNKQINKLFHYTNMNALLSIFDSYIKSVNQNNSSEIVDDCEFLATNIRFMNDSEELKEGKSFIEKIRPETVGVDINANFYIISFSKKGDILSQWKWYGKDSGISIEFNMNNIKYNWYKFNDVECDNYNVALPVNYKSDKKEAFLGNTVRKFEREKESSSNNFVKNMLIKQFVIPFCKNVGFEEEEESRLVFVLDKNIGNYQFDIEYKCCSNGVVKPALKVKFKAKNINKSIVKSFTVGPGQNQNLIFNALVHIFDRGDYHFYDEDDEQYLNEEDKKNTDRNYYYADFDGNFVDKDDNTKPKYITHRCKNGILIRKSAIPFRG